MPLKEFVDILTAAAKARLKGSLRLGQRGSSDDRFLPAEPPLGAGE
jgi:hypothetical protein